MKRYSGILQRVNIFIFGIFLFSLLHNYQVERFALIATTGKNAKMLTIPSIHSANLH